MIATIIIITFTIVDAIIMIIVISTVVIGVVFRNVTLLVTADDGLAISCMNKTEKDHKIFVWFR